MPSLAARWASSSTTAVVAVAAVSAESVLDAPRPEAAAATADEDPAIASCDERCAASSGAVGGGGGGGGDVDERREVAAADFFLPKAIPLLLLTEPAAAVWRPRLRSPANPAADDGAAVALAVAEETPRELSVAGAGWVACAWQRFYVHAIRSV